jgi:hypothetical protein
MVGRYFDWRGGGMGFTLPTALPKLARAFGLPPPPPLAGNLDTIASFPLSLDRSSDRSELFFIPVPACWPSWCS